MTSVNQLRETFLSYFHDEGHEVIPSSPLLPHHDPSLMFTNAGMVPFKNVFSGAEKIHTKKGVEVKRAASSQKCVRAGGKHNDLDNVGYTARHHTFFEMLGNFSFADYFKEEAIYFAWKFLTGTLEIPKEKLYLTVYHTDDEAFNLWKKISGFGEDRIIKIATQDNFWAMGDTGPCGPCSEIFYDHGDKVKGGLPGSADQDGDRYVEIWNLVFMQFEKLADGKQINLPKPCIDTGMGLERISSVMQGVHDNYETDLFKHLINASEHEFRKAKSESRISHRVIADHLRSMSFLIADGVLPSNEGRGYVLRRIMRRAMRHAHMLGSEKPVIYRLVPTLVAEMGQAFPELKRAEALVIETVRSEEERFLTTLGKGIKLLEEEIARSDKKISGEVAFKLYDTYGFPLDLTEDIAKSRNLEVDQAGFNSAMAEQKTKAKASWKGSGEAATSDLWFNLKEEHGATEFLGYQTLEATATLLSIVKNDAVSAEASEKDSVMLLVNQTPFYGESGGQAGDHGEIVTAKARIEITNTLKILGSLHVHVGLVKKGTIKSGETVQLKVDAIRRSNIRANHSATHLMHASLRKHLGAHVTQKGSLVEADYFRFDFSHPKPLTPEEINIIEAEVNAVIRQNTLAETRLMKTDAAIEAGAMALFGEKYGDEVRVLTMGEEASEKQSKPYSIELCGGTHVRATGDIGLFRITSQSSVAAGVRRIEAITAEAAYLYDKKMESTLNELSNLLKTSSAELPSLVGQLLEERKKLDGEVKELRKKAALSGGNSNARDNAQESAVEKIGDVGFMSRTLQDVPAAELKGLVDEFKKQLGSGVTVVISTMDDKVSMVIGVTEDLTAKISAVDLIRIATPIIGGKGGGGRPDLAQGGGANAANINDAIAAIRQAIKA